VGFVQKSQRAHLFDKFYLKKQARLDFYSIFIVLRFSFFNFGGLIFVSFDQAKEKRNQY
jgi:hypothetical protein